jgi:hypothetical protein
VRADKWERLVARRGAEPRAADGERRGRRARTGAQMSVLMLMLAGSDTSKMSHKVLLGVLPDLPQPVINRVRALPLTLWP